MRKVREVIRLHFECGWKHREIAAACSISPATVCDYLARAAQAGLGWEQARPLSDAEVEARLLTQLGRNEPAARAAIDFGWVHRELGRVGVTLQLLWGEYQAAAQRAEVRPYQYSQFCELYAGWRDQRRLSMRQVHRPGEKFFVDYSGKRPRLCDPETGEVREVELFVAVLGASNYTFAEVTLTQRVPDFIASTVRALEYFDAVPSIMVSDQLKSAVKKSDRYDPEITDALAELAQHYAMAAIPAPPASTRSKAKVETGVLIAQRWILARLRNRTFFSLAELNNAVAELVEELNHRRFQKLSGTRREAFDTIDRPSMKGAATAAFRAAAAQGHTRQHRNHPGGGSRRGAGPYSTGRASMIVTSNRDTGEWIAMFDDVLLAQSAVDRFKNTAYDFVIEGESYRPRLKPKLDPDAAPPPPPAPKPKIHPRSRR